MLQLNSKNIPYQSVQVFLPLVSKFSDIANKRQELKNNIDAILNSVLHKKK